MKIIASDYDGTLTYGGIDKKKREAVRKWRDAGNIFAIVSGRGPDDVPAIKKETNIDIDYFVADNGAVILDSKGEKVAEVRCDGKTALPLIELLFEYGCPFAHVHTAFPCRVYADEKNCTENGHYTLKNMPTVPYFNQISTQLPDFDSAEAVTSAVRKYFGEVVNPLQNGDCIDIVSPETDKAKGIYMLLDILNANSDDIIAVGDNINDRAMIEEFRSYAMANGVDFIKNLADGIVTSITELIEKEI